MSTAVEPGEEFEIKYRNGKHSLKAVALGFRSKRKVLSFLESFRDKQSPITARYDALEQAVRLCVPSITDATLDVVDESDMIEMVSNTLAASTLSEEQRKKFE